VSLTVFGPRQLKKKKTKRPARNFFANSGTNSEKERFARK
jgi:hypothetical protein